MPDNQLMGFKKGASNDGLSALENAIKERSASIPAMEITPNMVDSFPCGWGSGRKLVLYSEIYSTPARTEEVRLQYAQQLAGCLMDFAWTFQRECNIVEVRVHTDCATDNDVWVRFTHVGADTEFDKWEEDISARRPVSLQPENWKAKLKELGVGRSLAQIEADKASQDAGNPHPPGMG